MNALTPETLQLLQTVLDETWESLRPEEKSRTTKAEIGKRLLERAKEEREMLSAYDWQP